MIILLVCIGCLSLYSAAGGDWNPWANRHFQRSIIGFSLAFAIAITDITIIKTATPKLMPKKENKVIMFKKPSFFLVLRYLKIIFFSKVEINLFFWI